MSDSVILCNKLGCSLQKSSNYIDTEKQAKCESLIIRVLEYQVFGVIDCCSIPF